ncbi:MAG: ATP-binding protein [Patescibacteria group bacterium]|nr:ATP-binding protein [Patescibacteria group bacterium]
MDEKPNKPVKITITLPTDAYFLSGIRDFTLNMTKNMTGFSEQWSYRFQSVVDELCNNAIEHGSAPGEEIILTFISKADYSFEVVVEDTGTGINKYTAEQMQELLKEREAVVGDRYMGLRGRGLPKIVAEWTDELIFEDRDGGGLKVHAKKYLRKEEDEVILAEDKKRDPTHINLTA